LTQGRHGHSPEHLILRNEHTSLHLRSVVCRTITGACDLPSPWLAHHWLPLLTQPVESSPNSISPGGPWLKRAKCCERNEQADRIVYSLTARKLKSLSASASRYPTPPRSLHWLKWRWRGLTTIENKATLAMIHRDLMGGPIVFDEPRQRAPSGRRLVMLGFGIQPRPHFHSGRRCHWHARILGATS
jgi:hypothetical protein